MGKRKTIENKLSVFTNAILSIFGENPFKPMNYKQISKSLAIRDAAGKDVVYHILIDLFEQGILMEERPFRYVLNPAYLEEYGPKKEYVEGTVDMKSTGKAYVVLDGDSGEDVFISANNTGQALHGDRVKVAMFPKRKNKKPEGEIVEVLQRKHTDFVGVLHISHGYVFVVPDMEQIPVDIFVPKGELHGAKNGQKVIVHLVDWPENSGNPFGEIIRVLGNPGENDVEMQSILLSHDYPLDFPKEVEKEAAAIPVKIKREEIKKRRDFRDVFTITIDPADAKDFDDAISLQKLSNGHWEVGVHIADVSHYVKPGSAIDEEAYSRGTSVYLVDRTIPMLPEKLCNNVCSLRPDEEKLTFSAVFEMDDDANILNHWIGKTIIKSCRRYAYEEVQTMIEGGEGDYKDEIMTFNHLATKLREKRMAAGSLNFHSEEVKFVLDENGKPIDTYIRVQNESHELIEDFMLLANRTVAETFGKPDSKWKNYTFVYRVHDEPNPEKLNNFMRLISRLGYTMDISTRSKLVKSYNKLFEDVEGKGEKNLVESVAIRTMAKAVYSTENIGHYGLSFDYYTHFTSPIRRYPDLMVHRLIERYLIENQGSVDKKEFDEYCVHTSEMEKQAEEMERQSVKYKQAEYLQDKIGQVFDGLISGVSKWGLYVELKDSKCEGLVRYDDLPGDYYYLDEDNFRVIGQESGRVLQLGDEVTVMVKDVNLLKRQMDFELIMKDVPRKSSRRNKPYSRKKY
ncbi:MAG: ribonuclease R [Bacteroidales bacterium]|nr:ribonuclease R [Bacteroidales bacterium]MBQ6100822.1 ribonuclease R [Bacteroidales bacterium]